MRQSTSQQKEGNTSNTEFIYWGIHQVEMHYDEVITQMVKAQNKHKV
jgi:hypothetical protein